MFQNKQIYLDDELNRVPKDIIVYQDLVSEWPSLIFEFFNDTFTPVLDDLQEPIQG